MRSTTGAHNLQSQLNLKPFQQVTGKSCLIQQIKRLKDGPVWYTRLTLTSIMNLSKSFNCQFDCSNQRHLLKRPSISRQVKKCRGTEKKIMGHENDIYKNNGRYGLQKFQVHNSSLRDKIKDDEGLPRGTTNGVHNDKAISSKHFPLCGHQRAMSHQQHPMAKTCLTLCDMKSRPLDWRLDAYITCNEIQYYKREAKSLLN